MLRIVALALAAGLSVGPAQAAGDRPSCRLVSITALDVQRVSYSRIPLLVEERTVTRIRRACGNEIQTTVTRTPWIDVSGPR